MIIYSYESAIFYCIKEFMKNLTKKSPKMAPLRCFLQQYAPLPFQNGYLRSCPDCLKNSAMEQYFLKKRK